MAWKYAFFPYPTQNHVPLTLIKSISGIRGTIGGKAGENLTPQDIVESTAAFGAWLLREGVVPKVVIGRDGRMSGPMVSRLVANTLVGLGIDVVDLGQSTTPTVEMAVPTAGAGAGIIITASHNPKEWNALKFVNARGEFISAEDGEALLDLLASGSISYAPVDSLGQYRREEGYLHKHVKAILDHELVNVPAIRQRAFTVVVDVVNSTGALAMPPLLERMGCRVILLNGDLTGDFAHNPEPLPENLRELSERVVAEKADLGIAVDPDVDRLALVQEDGRMFGEEYTLVAVADYILSHRKGATVSNLSSTRALRDVSARHGCAYHASAVGEVNVVTKMKEVEAVIGGEGNGGIIVPDLHYGRDALAGIALFLSHLAETGKTASRLRASYPAYEIVKDRIELTPEIDVDQLLRKLEARYKNEDINTIDGLKIDFPDAWVHLRKSNTEPIIRVYAEAESRAKAKKLAQQLKEDALSLV